MSRQIIDQRSREAGDLSAEDVRDVVNRFLAPWQVARIVRAGEDKEALDWIRRDMVSSCYGSYGGGYELSTLRRGVSASITSHDQVAGEAIRYGVITWRLLFDVVADGVTPERSAALLAADRELRDLERHHRDDSASWERRIQLNRSVRAAAEAIVLAGPAAEQLDLLAGLEGGQR